MAIDQDNPFIERPDEHEAGGADEQYCWLPGNADRECNGSCVAYDPTYVHDQVRDSCKALNALRSVAKSAALFTNHFQQQQKREELAARQALADKLPSPPKV
jgi:hypothetical protein